MTGRERLPQRRRGETIDFTACGLVYTATLGHYPDQRLGEVFLHTGKSGAHASIASIETAIAVSFALQYGVPAEVMRDAMPRGPDGKAEGPMGTLLDLLTSANE